MRLPALIIGFRSFENIQNRVTELTKQGFHPIYVYLDGIVSGSPNVGDILESQELVRGLLNGGQIQFLQIASHNQGQGVAIPKAIDWLLSSEGSGVVIEDDCVVSYSAFSFLTEFVPIMEKSKACAGICLSNLLVDDSQPIHIYGQSSLFFNSWGWFVTRETWNNFLIKSPSYIDLVRATINLTSVSYYTRSLIAFKWFLLLRKKRKNLANTWALNFTLGALLRGAFFIIPSKNLIIHTPNSSSVHVKKIPSWYVNTLNSDMHFEYEVSPIVRSQSEKYEYFMGTEVHQAKGLYIVKSLCLGFRDYVKSKK